jgi:glycosyltransferase involved in cell wall biosynthesis
VQSFAWQACALAESLIESEPGIDVIEAPEFEAPAYFLQLRRALGMGPARQPPIVIHLHSPTELISRYNDWPSGLPDVLTAERLEAYSVGAADAWICPSAYLARQAEQMYGLEAGSIDVIRYPVGEWPPVERSRQVWERGSICYAGRLERRKGILEWIDAAVAVAAERDDLRFELVGANILGSTEEVGDDLLRRRIPAAVRDRFAMHGAVPRSMLPAILAGARIAVVPSRWENFPYVCLEAMLAGLPVLVTRSGGMAEIVEDERTGWIARSADAEELASTLRRALAASPERLAEMGAEAARTVRRVCAADEIVARHLELASRVRDLGAVRSSRVPQPGPGLANRRSSTTGRARPEAKRLGVVVAAGSNEDVSGTLASLFAQTSSAAAVAVVRPPFDLEASKREDNGALHVTSDRSDRASMINRGVAALEATGIQPLGWIFLDPRDRLAPNCLERCESVLHRCEEVGLVSSWVCLGGRRAPTLEALPCPSFPYQWLENQASGASAVRAEAWEDARGLRPPLSAGYEMWDLANAVLAAGWKAVTVPEVLCERSAGGSSNGLAEAAGPETMRRLLLERFPSLVARDAERLVLMTGSQPARKVRDAVRILGEYFESARYESARGAGRGWSSRARQRTAAPLLAVISWALRQAGK